MIFFMSKVHKKPYTAPQMERIARQSMYLYLPNLLTYGRIAAVPALVGCFFLDGDFGNWLSLAIFVVAALTDVLDGYVARAWEQQTSLGRMLDPIADKLLVSAALMMLAAQQTIAGWSLWAAIIILSREILVSGLREFLGEVNVSVPVSNLAKWKTVMQMVAIGFLLAGSTGDKIFPWTTLTGLSLLWISGILTRCTGWDYFRAGVKHVLEMGHE